MGCTTLHSLPSPSSSIDPRADIQTNRLEVPIVTGGIVARGGNFL